MAQSHPSDHRPHAKFSTSFASSSSSPSPAAAAAAAASPSPSSSDVLPSHPPSITNSQAFDVGASSPHHLHQFTNQCSTRPNADETPHMPSLFYLHHHHHHQQHHHQHDKELPISHNRESHIQTESAHRMNNNNETVSTSAASKGIEQALRSYVHGGISSPPSAPPRYHGSGLGANITGGVRDQPISFLQPQEASNRFYPANSTNTLKGGFPPTHRIAPRPLSNREEGPPNGISSRGPLNHDNDLFYTADSIQSSKGGLPPSDRPPYPISNREEGSSTTIGISTPTNTDTDRNARLSAISHSHSRFKPNGSPSPHIDHHHHPRVALDIMSDHRENTTSFLPSTHSIPEIDVAPSGNLPSSFPLNRGPFIPSSVHVESGHELIHGASKSGLLLHGSSSPAGFLSRTNNDGSSSGNSSDEGSYERQGRLPVAASAIHHQMKEPSTYFEGYTWDEAGNVMAGSANAAAPYSRKTFRDSDKYFTGPLLVDSQKGSTLGHGGLINHFTLGTTTSPESIYFTDRLSADSIPCRTRAKRGCATHPRSIAERVRRTKISERMKKLQELVPNMDKHTNTAEMLDEAVEYVKGLQHQVKELTEAQAKCSCSYSNTRKDQ